MSYYIIKQDTLIEEGVASIGRWPNTIDPSDWITGKPFPENLFKEKLIFDLSKESGDYRGDIIDGSLTLFSDELKEALESFGIDYITYYPVRLRDAITNETEGGFWLVNILELITCVDTEKSKIIPWVTGIGSDYQSIIIEEEKTNESKLFRLQEDPTLIIIHEELKKYLENEDCLYGVELIATEDYSDW